MASASSRRSCFHCGDYTPDPDHFRNGWRLRTGEHAQLCPGCASVFEEGRFCETFHSSDDGWRDCEYCGKLVHCGCIASFNAYLLLDFGGIICMECSKFHFIMARNHCLSRETQTRIGATQSDAARRSQIEPPNWPRVNNVELQQVSRVQKSVVTPLFEKLLSASDADLKLARLVIPKKCAEAYFPGISDPQGFPIGVLDTEGKEWEFHYRYWPNSASKMYVLEGLRDFMIAMRWQPGDTVTFYRMEPGGKLIIGLRKTSATLPPHEIWYDVYMVDILY